MKLLHYSEVKILLDNGYKAQLTWAEPSIIMPIFDFGANFQKEGVLYPVKCDMVVEAMCNANFAHFILYIPADMMIGCCYKFCNKYYVLYGCEIYILSKYHKS